MQVHHPAAGFDPDVPGTVAATLRFPGDRIAQFTCSYFADALDTLVVAGTKGSIQLNPCYMFGKPLEQHRAVGGKKTHESFKATDQFGGQMRYFSDCILNDRDPEPDVEEGLADLRVLDAIQRAIDKGSPQRLEPFARHRRIDPAAQLQTLRSVSAPEPVHASDPTRDKG